MGATYHITNVDWTPDYKNVRLFKNEKEQATYFGIPSDGLPFPGEEVNFKFDNMLSTSITFNGDDDTFRTIFNYNYLVVKDYDNGYSNACLFYFIIDTKIQNGGKVRLELQLDVWQTFLSYKKKFTNPIINRAHIDRFIPSSNSDFVQFNLKPDSKLWVPETQFAGGKRVERTEWVKWGDDANLNNFIKKYVKGVVVIYYQINGDTQNTPCQNVNKFASSAGETLVAVNGDYEAKVLDYGLKVESNIKAAMFPILIDGGKLSVRLPNSYWELNLNPQTRKDIILNIGSDGINGFINRLTKPNILDIQVLPSSVLTNIINELDYKFLSPEYIEITGYQLNNVINEITINNTDIVNLGYLVDQSDIEINGNIYGGAFSLNKGVIENLIGFGEIYNNTFSKESIIGSLKSLNREPKLLMEPYTNIEITSGGTTATTFEIAKLISNQSFKERYVLNPGIQKNNISLIGETGEIYNTYFNQLTSGLIETEDRSVPFITTQYENYIANNKNAYAQGWLAQTAGLLNNVGAGSGAVGLGVATDNTSSIFGGITQAATGAVSYGSGIAGMYMNFDNMKAAPGKLSPADTSVIIDMNIRNIFPFAIINSVLEIDKQRAYDVMYTYGYSLGIMDDPNMYIDTRKYFNYISVTADNINFVNSLGEDYAVSNQIKQKFLNIYKGVRIWHTDISSFNDGLENYEISLEV